jgi:sugar lactone lactonase YvrE
VEQIAAGYQLAEAPVASDDGGVLFSDVLGGGVHRWSPTGDAVETIIPKRRGIGGMANHVDGGLVVSGRDVSHVRDGVSRTLFAGDVAGLNDLTVDPDGNVIVGVLRFHPFAGEAPVPGEFACIDHVGAATTVVGDVDWANGCAVSVDGSMFYGCDYHRGTVIVADRHGDGTYGPSRLLVTSPSGDVDGLALDETGALWVALGGGGTVGRFTPEGRLDLELDVPAAFVSSVCFGGADGRDLFITTAGAAEDPRAGGVFVTRVDVAGAPIAAATI